MYQILLTTINDGFENIEIITRNKLALDSPLDVDGFQWRLDPDLQSKMKTLKTSADVLSDSLTKLTLIASKSPTESQLLSIVEEVKLAVGDVIASYLFTTEGSLSRQLFSATSQAIRGLLNSTRDVVKLLSEELFQHCKSATGMVWKQVKDIQQLPMGNKMACRRAWMENMTIVKETIAEFEGYLQEAAEKNARSAAVAGGTDKNSDNHQGGDIDDGDDSEDEEQDYTEAEVVCVTASVHSQRLALEVLKVGLQILTEVADSEDIETREPSPPSPPLPPHPCLVHNAQFALAEKLTSLSLESPIPQIPAVEAPGVVACSGGSGVTGIGIDEAGSKCTGALQCRRWVVELMRMPTAISGAVIDLGAELYPPVDFVATTELTRSLGSVALQCTALLLSPLYRHRLTVERESLLIDLEAQMRLTMR